MAQGWVSCSAEMMAEMKADWMDVYWVPWMVATRVGSMAVQLAHGDLVD